MLKSMTGFGRSEKLIDGYNIKVQLKSVNHRYSDFTIKVPRYYVFLEDKIRSAAIEAISRGKVEIFVTIEQKEDDDRQITLNRTVAEGYVNALNELANLGIRDDISVSTVSRLPDIFNVEYKEIDEEKLTDMVLEVFGEAVDGFMAMRIDEGQRLGESLKLHLASLLEIAEKIEQLLPECVNEYRNRLKTKIEEVLDDRTIDESRIITEAAIFADKIAVDEELVRLRSHVCAFEKTMNSDEPVGKKLDFIVQEMNREANTTGSKSNNPEITSYVVELKSVIEKIREQIQNIE